MARPKKVVDPEKVRELAGLSCTREEIAMRLGIHGSTLTRRFRKELELGHNECKISLRRKAYAMAMAGNVKVLLRMCEVLLGWARVSEVHEFASPVDAKEIAALRRELVNREALVAVGTDDLGHADGDAVRANGNGHAKPADPLSLFATRGLHGPSGNGHSNGNDYTGNSGTSPETRQE